jgi:hypothetical protein
MEIVCRAFDGCLQEKERGRKVSRDYPLLYVRKRVCLKDEIGIVWKRDDA